MNKFLLIIVVLFSGISFVSIQGCENKNNNGAANDLNDAIQDSAAEVKEMGRDAAEGAREMGQDAKRAVEDATD